VLLRLGCIVCIGHENFRRGAPKLGSKSENADPASESARSANQCDRSLNNSLYGNHEGDRHVLAADLIAKAHVIVTKNLKHFPTVVLSQYQVEAQSADQFLTYLHDLFPQEIRQVLQTQASDLKKPPMSVTDLLNVLKTSVPNFVGRFN
jgi:predicted nuclease of restriction endonuclease-like RecB superfamily